MVKPKKHLGQHFLTDDTLAKRIVNALEVLPNDLNILEIGPGTGILTKYLLPKFEDRLYLIDVDKESIDYLRNNFTIDEAHLINDDFLKKDLSGKLGHKYAIIGNFPYNISSQIFFRVLDKHDRVVEVVCMLQREVAKRLVSPPGNKDYGILSVLLQAYYDMEYLFTVNEGVFNPPPKVKSGVIRLRRNYNKNLNCDPVLFKKVVKQGFQNRRKTLRNALKPLNLPAAVKELSILSRRAEQLSVNEFEHLTLKIESGRNHTI